MSFYTKLDEVVTGINTRYPVFAAWGRGIGFRANISEPFTSCVPFEERADLFSGRRRLPVLRARVEKIVLEVRVLEEDKHVALPSDRIGFTYFGIVYEITLEELEKMPAYDYRR